MQIFLFFFYIVNDQIYIMIKATLNATLLILNWEREVLERKSTVKSYALDTETNRPHFHELLASNRYRLDGKSKCQKLSKHHKHNDAGHQKWTNIIYSQVWQAI
jgi:predicted DCC family thiol-disulfide oxidoreductase YuxK